MRHGLYELVESTYRDVLYGHILSDQIFPDNDGVVREAQTGWGEGVKRVDILTRYGSPATYFAIEVKYWPHDFETGFRQATALAGCADGVYLAVPLEHVSVALTQRTNFSDVGVIPVSPIYQGAISHRATRTKHVNSVVRAYLARKFDDVDGVEPRVRKFWRTTWDTLQRSLRGRRWIAFLTLWAVTQVYSYVKFVSWTEFSSLARKLMDPVGAKSYMHPEWTLPGLVALGIVEEFRGPRTWFYRLHRPFAWSISDKGGPDNLVEKRLDMHHILHGFKQFVAERRKDVTNKVGKHLTDYLT